MYFLIRKNEKCALKAKKKVEIFIAASIFHKIKNYGVQKIITN